MRSCHFLLVLLIASLSCAVAVGQAGTAGGNVTQAQPVFSIHLSDGSLFTEKGLPTGTPVLIGYIDPTCHHCQLEVMMLQSRRDSLGELQMVLVAAKPDGLADLLKGLSWPNKGYPNLRIGYEEGYKLYDYYGLKGPVPFNALYNRKGELVRQGVQDFKIEDLKVWVIKEQQDSQKMAKP